MPRQASAALDRFSEWLSAYGDAWEAADSAGAGALFTVGATLRPAPFAELVRGRREIAEWYAAEFQRWTRPSFSAQVLGVGDTYAVAHWLVASEAAAVDGVLVAALDERGRCTSLRMWWHESFSVPAAGAVH